MIHVTWLYTWRDDTHDVIIHVTWWYTWRDDTRDVIIHVTWWYTWCDYTLDVIIHVTWWYAWRDYTRDVMIHVMWLYTWRDYTRHMFYFKIPWSSFGFWHHYGIGQSKRQMLQYHFLWWPHWQTCFIVPKRKNFYLWENPVLVVVRTDWELRCVLARVIKQLETNGSFFRFGVVCFIQSYKETIKRGLDFRQLPKPVTCANV